MKTVWVYVMLASGTGFVAILLSALDKYESKGCSISVIVRGCLSLLFLIITIVGFIKASKYGKIEDEYKMPRG
jgi:hypothetical protein